MKLSLMLLKHRLLFSCCIVIVIMISTTVNFFSSILTHSVLQYKWNQGIQSYGNFSCGLNNISNEEMNILQNQYLKNMGTFITYNNIKLEDLIITVGYVDDSFFDMAGIKLNFGRFPQTKDEVVVEEFVANMLGNTNSIEIKYNNNSIKMKIVGVIDNYSSKLSLPYENNNMGNVYPNIICNRENYFKSQEGTYSVLLNLDEVVDVKDDYIKNTQNIYNSINKKGLSTNKLYFNDGLLNRGLAGCKEIWYYSLFFSFSITLIFAICIYVILKIFYKNYKKKLSILNALGKVRGKLVGVIGYQLLLFYIVGNFFGIIISCLIINSLKSMVNYNISNMFKFTILNLLCWEITLLCVMLLLLLEIKIKIFNHSMADNMFCRNKRLIDRSNKEKWSCKGFMDNIKKANILFVLLFTAVFMITYFSLYIHDITIQDIKNIPDYQLFSKAVVETEIVNGFIIEDNPEKFISESDVRKLQNYSSAIIYDLWPNFNNCTILFEQDNIPEYFRKWNSLYEKEETNYEKSIIQQNWPQSFENLVPVNNVDFVVANDTLLSDIIEQYGLAISLTEFKSGSEIMLFLPDNIQKQNGIEKGEIIKIGSINRYDNQVVGKQFALDVAEVIYEPYSLKTDYTLQKRDSIIVVMSEEIAKKSNLFEGYKNVSVRLKENTSYQTITEIDNLMNEMSTKIQGSILYSKRELLSEEKIFRVYNKIISSIILSINLVFGGIIVMIMFQVVKKNKKRYGVLRALGMSCEKNITYLWKCFTKSIIISYVFDFILALIFLDGFENFLYFMDNFCIAIGQTLFLLLLICLVTYNALSKMNIKDMITEN